MRCCSYCTHLLLIRRAKEDLSNRQTLYDSMLKDVQNQQKKVAGGDGRFSWCTAVATDHTNRNAPEPTSTHCINAASSFCPLTSLVFLSNSDELHELKEKKCKVEDTGASLEGRLAGVCVCVCVCVCVPAGGVGVCVGGWVGGLDQWLLCGGGGGPCTYHVAHKTQLPLPVSAWAC